MLRLTWQTAEPDALAARLARLGFALATGPAERVARLVGAEVAIAERGAKSLEGLLTLVDATEHAGSGSVPDRDVRTTAVESAGAVRGSGLRLAALGWATVDLERAAREFGDIPFEPAEDDAALGARAFLGGLVAVPGDQPDGDPALVLLEPSTEGRLAARLARHGEGPAVLYVAGPGGMDATAAAWRAAGIRLGSRASGPLGPSVVALGPVGGPEVVAVE